MHWVDLEGSGGEGGGRGDWDGVQMLSHGCFISMYDKIHYNKKKKKRLQDISVMVIHSVWLGRVFKMDPEENAFGKVGGCFLPCLRALDFIL